MEYVNKIFDRAFDYLLDLTIRHVWYIIEYTDYVDELNSCVADLGRERERVSHQVHEAENNDKPIEATVNEWLENVKATIKQYDAFLDDAGHRKTTLSNAFILSYLWNRHKLGRQAFKMTAYVKSIIQGSNFERVYYQQNITSNDAALSNASYIDFGSRKLTMEKIMEKLQDSTVRMIGMHGPGGVGKSTFVREIGKKAEERRLFTKVIFLDITNSPNPQKIQDEIAYVLELRFEGEGEIGRADRLRRRLKNEKENTLLILDDVWDKLDLNRLGIPFDDDGDDDLSHKTIKDGQDPILNQKMVKKEKPLGDYKGCKILITSRDRKVLSDEMDVKTIFRVEKLNEKDTLMLFKKVAGITDNDAKFDSKKDIIDKYCAGIPMAIVTVGRALKNKSESVWDATLEKLKQEELVEVQRSMEISVKVSYDHLESEELKSIFLLCAQMGHHPLIMDLVKYCFSLGILEGVHTITEARDRIHVSIQKLKESSLLYEESSSDRFNMHDMVRDAALSIAHKEQNVFTLTNGKLDDWPDKDELKRCTAISIRNCHIIDELPKVMYCPQLKFFQVESDDPSLRIPDNFFKGMEKLKVLILTGIHLHHLPSSIKRLSNLRMLCLERCLLAENLSFVGELKKLRILSFSGTQIEILPAELGCLDKLQLFDISHCSIAKVMEPNFISRMTFLEELYIRKSLVKMGDEDQNQKSFLSELKHLHQLKIVDLCIPSAAVLPRDLFFDKLNDYKVLIGDCKMLSVGGFRMPHKYEASRSLALQLDDSTDIHSHKGIKLLFKRVENLLLGELNGVRSAFYELNLDGFPDLKHLSIINNSSIEYIINSVEFSHPQNVFPNLESLYLYKLWNIKVICRSPITDASFTKLKTIKVKLCSYLKNLFSFHMVKLLVSLETIDVSECDSLKEIVVKETQVNSDKVVLHKLRSLTLQSLPSLACFYAPQSIEAQTTNMDHVEIAIEEDERSVFSELVETPNLETLMLSSIIDIHQIWSGHPQFRNLIKLTVEGCDKMKYLCSLSVAKSLENLKGLFISECHSMEKIFVTEGNSVDKVCIFPKLEEIRLSNMDMLEDIWQTEVDANSFSSLISLHIGVCSKLKKIFPSHMAGRFGSLESLKVVNCNSVEVIFEMNNDSQEIDTKLQHINLHWLPNLKQVLSKHPPGILNLSNLQDIKVAYCDELSHVLPASVAKGLKKLESISVASCYEMEKIVAPDDGSETMNEPLEFPEVTCIDLSKLFQLKHFYMGTHTIECPKLKKLKVHLCKNMATFSPETSNNDIVPVFSAEKVISNLESLEIDLKDLNWLKRNIGKYPMQSLKELSLSRFPSDGEPLYWFLHRMPNLERLELLWPIGTLKEFVPSGSPPERLLGTVLQLKELALSGSGLEDLGLERDPVLQRLEHLRLYYSDKLTKLAPSSISLTHMTYLEVEGSSKFTNLMAITTAKSLVQLETLKVIRCDNVKEIVTKEGDDEEEKGKIEVVVFSKLITLELVSLKCLTSFCSYKNCEFKFPSLERLAVIQCPAMKAFTESHAMAPKLQNIIASFKEEEEEEEKWHWEGDLNTTIRTVFKDKVYLQYAKYLNLSNHPEIIDRLWYGKDSAQESYFGYLKRLEMANCDNLVHAIPSHLLLCFENLEELTVSSCKAVQVIFNINEIKKTKALGIIRLKKLSLTNLPELVHVWDKDPKGIISLQELQDISVDRCDSLKSILPAYVAKDLTKLEKLQVDSCGELVEIFSKDEIIIEAQGVMKKFVFPHLTQLVLKSSSLKYFYPASHIIEWPVLEDLTVLFSYLVTSKPHPYELVEIEKVIQIPSFKRLAVSIEDNVVVWFRESAELRFGKPVDHFHKEYGLYDDDDEYRYGYGFLDVLLVLPNNVIIEKLALRGCSFKKMLYERPYADYTTTGVVLSHLNELELDQLDNLDSIGFELHPNIPQNLQTLRVMDCDRLNNLVPCTVSFSSLTSLKVFRCTSMRHLFTSSTAKSLVHLKRMEIERCHSMEEIIAESHEEEMDEQVVFEKLQVLHLEYLDKLSCFYPGNSTLHFPSLEQVIIIDCGWMKTFCPFHKLSSGGGVTFTSKKNKEPQWVGDLNSTLLNNFDEMILEDACCKSFLRLSDDAPIQEIWLGSLPIPDTCFSNLTELVVLRCKFLSNVIPSNLLPFFTKLEKLQVLYCNSVKTIFDVKCSSEEKKMSATMGPALHPINFPLKKLDLMGLPNLENVWNEDPLGILSIQNLQDVHVDGCKCLTSLFPASVAKDLAQVKTLTVKNCEELRVIVAEDNNADPKGTSLDLMFPSMTSLTLFDLPKLISFNTGISSTLSFPSLKELSLINCHMMETFCPGTININAEKLLGVKFLQNSDAVPLEEADLNSTIRKAFPAKAIHPAP